MVLKINAGYIHPRIDTLIIMRIIHFNYFLENYSKTCLKRPLKNRQNKDPYDK